MRAEDVAIESASVKGIPVVRLDGPVDLDNSPSLRKALKKLVGRRLPALIVSVGRESRLDTSALATLVECAHDMGRSEGRLAVVGLSTQATDAFSMAQLEGIFLIFDSEAEAAESLAPGQ